MIIKQKIILVDGQRQNITDTIKVTIVWWRDECPRSFSYEGKIGMDGKKEEQ